MRLYERFCGVRVVTYCVMSNHFHVLVEVPQRPTEVPADAAQFFLRLHGLWEWKRNGHRLPQAARRVERRRHQRVIDLPPPPDPPFGIETFEPIEPPWQAVREWIPDDDAEAGFDLCFLSFPLVPSRSSRSQS